VDEGGIVNERLIDVGDNAGYRAVEVIGGLHRLYDPEGLHVDDGRPLFRELDEDDVFQLSLGIVSDAHEARARSVQAKPRVFGVVFQIFGIHLLTPSGTWPPRWTSRR